MKEAAEEAGFGTPIWPVDSEGSVGQPDHLLHGGRARTQA